MKSTGPNSPQNPNFRGPGLNGTFKHKRLQISKPTNLKTTKTNITKFLQGVFTMKEPLWVVHDFQ